ncbi:MAG: GGDEF domain-containing protein [Rubrivivax sp.]|nr:GGDEF domain-containing protein [Rubrivivax sp.]
MLHVDILTAYLNCGVAALAGAAMLRFARTDDARLRRALALCGFGLLVLGTGLLPAGLGEAAAHPAAQFSMAWGSLAGIVLMSRGLAQVQGRDLPAGWVAAAIAALALGTMLSLAAGPALFGRAYACALAATTTTMAWYCRGLVASPRNPVERAFGLVLVGIAASSWLRLAFTLAYDGPARTDLLYLPAAVAPAMAAAYGVVPIVVATLLLGLVNARLHQQLHSRATTDELTGVLTRRALRELAPALVDAEQAGGGCVAVLMLDLDHFKAVNDLAGHAGGDLALRLAAATLQSQLRPDTLLARYGGEEFVAVMPVPDLPAARRASERLRLAVEQADWRGIPGLSRGLTVSIGVALAGPAEALDAVMARADEALYRAKRDGRNQVQVSLMVA